MTRRHWPEILTINNLDFFGAQKHHISDAVVHSGTQKRFIAVRISRHHFVYMKYHGLQ